jgi:hypothetical protein
METFSYTLVLGLCLCLMCSFGFRDLAASCVEAVPVFRHIQQVSYEATLNTATTESLKQLQHKTRLNFKGRSNFLMDSFRKIVSPNV